MTPRYTVTVQVVFGLGADDFATVSVSVTDEQEAEQVACEVRTFEHRLWGELFHAPEWNWFMEAALDRVVVQPPLFT